jgi:hypothetical protein
MIDFKCPGCGKSFTVKDASAGKKTKCPKCGVAMRVPGAAAPPAGAPAAGNSASAATTNPFEVPPDTTGNTPAKGAAQKPRSGPSPKTVFIGCGALLGLLLLASCIGAGTWYAWSNAGAGGWKIPGGADPKIAGAGGAKANAMEVTAKEVRGAYAANGVAADEKYKGKTVRIEGVLQRIGTDGDGKLHLFVYGGFDFYFDDDHKGEVAKLSKDQIVAVQGTLDGENLTVRKCEFVLAKPIPLELSAYQLGRERVEDRILCDARYKGKTLKVTGKLRERGIPSVSLDGFPDPEWDLGNVWCNFDEYPQQELERIPKGQIITIRGKYNPGGINGNLRACELVK